MAKSPDFSAIASSLRSRVPDDNPITLKVTHIVNPADVTPYIEAISSIMDVNKSDDGCMEYAFLQDIEQANQFVMHEKWESMDALERHWQQPHFGAFLPKFERYLAEPLQVRYLSSIA